METLRKVYNKILKETKDEAENTPFSLVKLYMEEYAKIVVDECAKVYTETPIGNKYTKILEVKTRIK